MLYNTNLSENMSESKIINYMRHYWKGDKKVGVEEKKKKRKMNDKREDLSSNGFWVIFR